jgi:hypothetical protein
LHGCGDGAEGVWQSPINLAKCPAIEPHSMIVVTFYGIGAHGKSEKIFAADPGPRLVIEWTTQLAATRRNTGPR